MAVRDALCAAAETVTASVSDDPTRGILVVVLRPDGNDQRVIGSGGTGVLRAAVSVAVAAGNDRIWRDAPTGMTEERSTRALPEVVASAADADGVRAAHIGCVRRGESLEAVAIWFETWAGVARADDRATVLGVLEAAAQTAAAEAAERAASVVQQRVEPVEESTTRSFDPDDPRLESATGLLNSATFDECLDEFEGEEATILLIDVDDLDGAHDGASREVADRLVAGCRRSDAIACINPTRFAILLRDIDRPSVLELGRRLLARISDPLPDELGSASLTATIALAHQVGLVDVEEMFASAQDAVVSGKRAGSGRLVLAA